MSPEARRKYERESTVGTVIAVAVIVGGLFALMTWGSSCTSEMTPEQRFDMERQMDNYDQNYR